MSIETIRDGAENASVETGLHARGGLYKPAEHQCYGGHLQRLLTGPYSERLPHRPEG